jgi:rubrerythrin
MSSATALPEIDHELSLLAQYTMEAYKTFQKLSEMLPNPMAAAMFTGFATDERHHRDLLETKYVSGGRSRMPVTLGADLRFQDMLEGNLSYRELAEFLIGRERTMERKLQASAKAASEKDRNLLRYIAAGKRAHIALLERELELILEYPDWFKREDAESVVVLGEPAS